MARCTFFASFGIFIIAVCLFLAIGTNQIDPVLEAADTTPTLKPTPRVATAEELAAARSQWQRSAHADTYDNGMGANTTCARCKSPLNWDPGAPAAEVALDCASCKRIPGQQRPELTGGISVPTEKWQDIGCEICHEPVGDSYLTSIAFWNNASHSYEEVENTTELCAHCHEGRHGFAVVEEQSASPAHNNWDCTRCHGPHGESSSCADCHDPAAGNAALDHMRHTLVNCTACHDAGGLSVALERDPKSKHSGTYMTQRYAHTITSWSSHNLKRAVNCGRCHHRKGNFKAAVAPEIGCQAPGCHEVGAVLNWCPDLPRDPEPTEYDEP